MLGARWQTEEGGRGLDSKETWIILLLSYDFIVFVQERISYDTKKSNHK